MVSMDKGYVKIYRDICDNFVWKDKPFSRGQAWIDLLLMVNHADKKLLFMGNLITIKRGSKITSLRKLSERWGWSKDKVAHFLDVLESDKMISQKRDSKKTLINVINYDYFQSQRSSKKTVKRQSSDTERTLIGRSSDADRNKQYIIKNDKGIIKNEEEYRPSVFSENDATDEEEGWGYE